MECRDVSNGITGILFAYIVFKEMIDAGRILFYETHADMDIVVPGNRNGL